MAERRMFAKTIIDSDAFLDMPLSTHALYFHLSMRADDDGFINNPKKIQRMIGASDDDLKLLIAKKFIIPFESGIVVIKHWKIHNYIRNDRYKPTNYQEEKAMLSEKENKSYTLNLGIPNGDQMETEVSIGKVRLGEDSLEEDSIVNTSQTTTTKRFKKPTIEEIEVYCQERGNNIDAESFFDYYESKDWMIGKNRMKDWKAAIRTWERNRQKEVSAKNEPNPFDFF